MITLSGTVHGGLIRLPEAVRVADGARVMIAILEPVAKSKSRFLPEDIETGDLEFVRACRGRIAKQLQEMDE